MIQDSTENKPFVEQRGGFAHGLSEYISRECRWKLFDTIYNAVQEDIRISKNMKRRNGEPVGRKTVSNYLSEYFGVTLQAIRDWHNKTYHPCNSKTDKIVKLALDVIPHQAVDILEEDMETHRLWFESVAFNVQSGVFVPKHVEVPT